MKRWLLALGAVTALGGAWYAWRVYWRVEAPILVGILHSQSGPLKISEESMIDAELMAIAEINQRGLLGREVKPIIADGRSDPVERLYTTWGTNEFNPQTVTDAPEPAPALTRRPLPGTPKAALFSVRKPRPYQR